MTEFSEMLACLRRIERILGNLVYNLPERPEPKPLLWHRCANPNCSNSFLLGKQPDGSPRTTARRKFCSDYCRVAAARLQKRSATA